MCRFGINHPSINHPGRRNRFGRVICDPSVSHTSCSFSLTRCSSGFPLQQHRHQKTITQTRGRLRSAAVVHSSSERGRPVDILSGRLYNPRRAGDLAVLGMFCSARDEQATTAVAAAEDISTPGGVWSSDGYLRCGQDEGDLPHVSACKLHTESTVDSRCRPFYRASDALLPLAPL